MFSRRPTRIARLASVVIGVTLAVAACRTAPPPPPPPADLVFANQDPGTPVASLSLAPGESINYRLDVPAGVAQAHDVIYLELDSTPNGVLELRNAGYWGVLASSASPDRFVRGALPGVPQPNPGATAVGDVAPAEQLEPQAVNENRACLGPCVIFRPESTTYHVRVLNDTGSQLTADLYAYGYALQDSGEPQNDSRQTAPVLAATNAGAIETLNDTDFWVVPGHISATVTTVANGIDVTTVVVNASGVVVAGPYATGQAIEAFTGESLRVRASGNEAAAPARSTYFIETTSLPGNPNRPPTFLEVTANNSGAAVDQRTVPAGGVIEYRVTIPATVRSRDVVYFEIDRNIGLQLRTSSNLSAIASSSSSNMFAGGGTLAFSSGDVEGDAVGPQAITPSKACRGSCIIAPANANSLFLRVHGGATATNFTLFVYGSSFMDPTEPANNTRGAVPLDGDDSGAIETIGDVDMFRVPTVGRVRFDTAGGGPALQAVILDIGGNPIPGLVYSSGANFCAYDGETIRVSAINSSQAAASARSSYWIESGAPGPICPTSLTERTVRPPLGSE